MSDRRAKSPPKIAVDTWTLGAQAVHHGVQVYTKKLLWFFRELAPEYGLEIKPYVRAGTNGNDLAPADGFHPRATALLAHGRMWRFGGAWSRAALDGMNLIFHPHWTSFCPARPVPIVTTIHDVIPVFLPERSRKSKTLRFLLWSAAKNSRTIITDSESSKADLMRVYGLPESRIHVVYLGCDHDTYNDSLPDPGLARRVLARIGAKRPYLLYYGAIKPNKNLKRLILAYRALMQRNAALHLDLVLAGTPDSAYDEVAACARDQQNGRGRVILTGGMDQCDLVALIKGATLAVFPSLYEGFCLPMIESMACGIPTIAANSSCLPEVSGGVLRYFDPECVEDMSSCLEAVVSSPELRKELAAKGLRRAAEFDWRRCAQQTLALLALAARREHSSMQAAGDRL